MDTIRNVMASPRGGRPVCVLCGRAVSATDDRLRLRADLAAHRRCATYNPAQRRSDATR
jgi:hypothetical protein